MNKTILQIIDVWILVLFLFVALLIGITRGYKIERERDLDANCLGYSKEVRDEIRKEGGTATLIGFRKDKKQGHCLVLVNYKTRDWKIIESYTGEEFTDITTLWGHLIFVLGEAPNSVSIKKGNKWGEWQDI